MNALIKPDLLRWALDRSRTSLEFVARSVKVKPEQLRLWQKGEEVPNFLHVQRLAQALHVPLGYLFLSSPPVEKLPLPDLRTVKNVDFQSPTAEFLDLLNDVLRKHDWYREYMQERGDKPLEFIKRFTISDKVEQIAEDISRTLGIDEVLREKATSWEDFLRRFIDAAQGKGILVLRSGIVGNNTHRKLSVEEFRGFVISDELAPIVFINGRDTKAAQIFTLAHELTHLWLGESGISNFDISQPSTEQKREIELFCNRVAAELLVPERSFLKNWVNGISFEDNLYKLVRRYRVSSLVILRRAIDLRKITPDEYRDFYQKELQRLKEYKRRGDKSGGDFYATLFARNSNALTIALVSGILEGKVLYREASQLLGVKKIKTLHSIAIKFGMK